MCNATKIIDTYFSYKRQCAYAHKLHVKAATCDTPSWTGHIQASSTQSPVDKVLGYSYLPAGAQRSAAAKQSTCEADKGGGHSLWIKVHVKAWPKVALHGLLVEMVAFKIENWP